MGADLGALLHDHDGDIRIDLLEADGGGEAGRAGTNYNHLEFHRLAGRQVGHAGLLAPDIPLLHSRGNRARAVVGLAHASHSRKNGARIARSR